MLEGEEVVQSDANISTEESSTPQETSAPENAEVSAQASIKAEPQVPFHEHPRFKELIEEKRQYADQMSQMRKQMEDMQRRYEQANQPQKKDHPFVEALKGVDPKWGEWGASVEEVKEKLAEFQAWRQEQQHQSLVKEYEMTVERLANEHKVPAEIKELIKDNLDARALRDPRFGLKDVPAAYKEISDKYMKLLDTTKRNERASYVKDKSKDSKVPASANKGTPTQTKGGKQAPVDRESAYANIVKSALTKSRAEGDI